MTHLMWTAILLLYLIPVLLFFLTWRKPYLQARGTLWMGQVITMVAFVLIYPCISWTISWIRPLDLLWFWTGEGCLNWLIVFPSIVLTGILATLRKRVPQSKGATSLDRL